MPESKSIQPRSRKYIYKIFSALKVEVHLAGKDQSTVNLEAFINFYINKNFSAGKPHAENSEDTKASETDLRLFAGESMTVKFCAMKSPCN